MEQGFSIMGFLYCVLLLVPNIRNFDPPAMSILPYFNCVLPSSLTLAVSWSVNPLPTHWWLLFTLQTQGTLQESCSAGFEGDCVSAIEGLCFVGLEELGESATGRALSDVDVVEKKLRGWTLVGKDVLRWGASDWEGVVARWLGEERAGKEGIQVMGGGRGTEKQLLLHGVSNECVCAGSC